LKNNLTIPKVKDLVSKPQKQYDEIFKVMENPRRDDAAVEINKDEKAMGSTSSNMKSELTKYLNNLQKTPDDIKSVGSNFNSFDAYNKY
jgi:flagellar basal body P-ring protein FlgI